MGGAPKALKTSSYWGISILGNLRIDIYQINNWNIYIHMYIIYAYVYYICICFLYIYICIYIYIIYICISYIYVYYIYNAAHLKSLVEL